MQYARLQEEDYADPEDPEEYLAANVFWVPAEARWAHLQAHAKRPEITFVDVTTGREKKGDIGGLIDNAMEAIEQANIKILKDVLPKAYSRPQFDKTMLGELIDLFSNVDMRGDHGQARDRLGRAYEYFISQFAGAEVPPSLGRQRVECGGGMPAFFLPWIWSILRHDRFDIAIHQRGGRPQGSSRRRRHIADDHARGTRPADRRSSWSANMIPYRYEEDMSRRASDG